MSTKISYQTWSGGEGWNDPVVLIGYCEESPIEVLEKVILTHDVYHYKELYRPIDYAYPNNVMGLIIEELDSNNLGIKSLGGLEDLDISRALTKNTRTKDTILKSLQSCREWHTYSNEELNNKYSGWINEVNDVILELV